MGADVLDGRIAVGGWQEDSSWEIDDFLRKYTARGIKYVISTDVSKDGVLAGPSIDLYRGMVKSFPELEVIASGGVSKMDDVYALDLLPLHGVIVGKAIYENRISLKEIEEFVSKSSC